MKGTGKTWTLDANRRWQLFVNAPILGVIMVLGLMAASVVHHPSSVQGAGNRLLWMDTGLLLFYAIAAFCLRHLRKAGTDAAISLGTWAGLLLAAILVANHVGELFLPVRSFALVISPVLLTFALLGATGSIARERTGSLLLAMLAGLWCAMIGTLILLCAGFILSLTMEAPVELWLREAFLASAMRDPGGFVVQNTLEAASEGLVRMPVLALFLSLLGASADAWVVHWPRAAVLVAGSFVPCMFAGGAAALWYANSLPRTARSPFVLTGVLLACTALSTAVPVWSAMRPFRVLRQ